MKFRPCIDIHNGKVKQIVGSTLRDEGDRAAENFVAEKNAAYYARLYKEYGLTGGHVIMLNHADSEYYRATKQQALEALAAYPQGLMAGGGIDPENASEFIDAGASHVIVTSYVFSNGIINRDNLERMSRAVGRDHLVLDLSCRFMGGTYLVSTDRWQHITDVTVDRELFDDLGRYCDAFLVHAVDSEGLGAGIDERLVSILAESPLPVCYAGGVSSTDDILRLREMGHGRVDFTVGSKLDIFGGSLSIEEIARCIR